MHTGLGTPNSDFVSHAEPKLGYLRAQIKKVMIPLLIKIFELKLAGQQAQMPPSRLQNHKGESADQILAELRSLEEELKVLQLWCLSCQKQVEKALEEVSPKGAAPHYTTPAKTSAEQTSTNWLSKFLKR